jgi:hypothetical protein
VCPFSSDASQCSAHLASHVPGFWHKMCKDAAHFLVCPFSSDASQCSAHLASHVPGFWHKMCSFCMSLQNCCCSTCCSQAPLYHHGLGIANATQWWIGACGERILKLTCQNTQCTGSSFPLYPAFPTVFLVQPAGHMQAVSRPLPAAGLPATSQGLQAVLQHQHTPASRPVWLVCHHMCRCAPAGNDQG